MSASSGLRLASVAAALLVTACGAQLSMPDGAVIECDSDAQCPLDYRCKVGVCRAAGNESPVAAVGDIERDIDAVAIPVTVTDIESDLVHLTLAVSESGGTPVEILTVDVQASPTGERVEPTWDAAAHFPDTSLREGLVIHATPSDGTTTGATATSQPFVFGNNPPTVMDVTFDDARVRGLTVLRITVADESSDPVDLHEVVLSRSGTFDDNETITVNGGPGSNFPTGALVSMDTQPVEDGGIQHSLAWNSVLEAPYDAAAARLRITVRDSWGGSSEPFPTDAFQLDNGNTAPTITLDSWPVATVTTQAQVGFTIADADGDACSIVVEYSTDGSAWSVAASTDATTGLAPGSHTFAWEATQLASGYYPDTVLRFTVFDSLLVGNAASTPAFAVDTRVNAAPAASLGSIQSSPRYLTWVDVPFSVSDENDNAVSVALQYSTDGATWSTGTLDAALPSTGLSAPPGGATHTVRWNAAADLTANVYQADTDGDTNGDTPTVSGFEQLYVRITPTDDASPPATGSASEPASFAFGNDAPTAEITGVFGEQDVAIEFLLSDSHSDPVDIEIQFRRSPGDAWRAPAISLGETRGLATAPGGRPNVVVWDSAAPVNEGDPTAPQGVGFNDYDTIQLQIRAIDTPDGSATHFGPWWTLDTTSTVTVDNQTPPRIESVYAKQDGGLRTGAIPIVYRLVDEEWDPVDVIFEYSLDDGGSWLEASEYAGGRSEGTRALATAPESWAGGRGILHTFTWESTLDLFGYYPSVRLRARAEDGRGESGIPEDVIQLGPVGLPPGATPFLDPVPYQTGGVWTATSRLALADFDGDTILDVVESRHIQGEIGVVLGNDDGSGNPDGTFGAFSVFVTGGTQPKDLVIGLFDADAILDIAVANTGSDDVAVLLGNGAGGFTPATGSPFAVDGKPAGLAQGDFDGDGTVDLVVPHRFNMEAELWSGQGDGTFVSSHTFAIGNNARAIVADDFNDDGLTDVAIGAGDLEIYLVNDAEPDGLPDGTFASAEVTVTSDIQAMASVDLDRDGHRDLVLGHLSHPRVVTRLLGAGDGSFSLATFPSGIPATESITVGDINGDGLEDAVTCSQETGEFAVMLGNGRGDLGAPARFPAGGDTVDVQVADLDGDGRADVAVAATPNGSTDPALWIVRANSGSSSAELLSDPTTYAAGTEAGLTRLDLDSDGAVDLIGGNETLPNAAVAGVGTAVFGTRLSVLPYMTVARGDFDGDGVADACTAKQSTGGGYFYPGHAVDGVGDGTFGSSTSLPNSDGAYAITSCDLDGNGALDVAAVRGLPYAEVRIYMGQGNGTFVESTDSPMTAGTQPWRIQCAELNADGNPDLIVGGGETLPNVFQVFVGQGDGTFTPAASNPLVSNVMTRDIEVGDLNNDGHADIVFSQIFSARVSVLLGNGDMTFQPETHVDVWVDDVNDSAQSIVILDLDRDGNQDLVVAVEQPDSLGDSLAVLLGVGDGSFAAPIYWPAGGEEPAALTTGDFNGDGAVDLVAANAGSELIALYTGRRSFRQPWYRPLAPFDSTTGTGEVIGADTAPAGVDLLGVPWRATIGLRPFQHGGDQSVEAPVNLGELGSGDLLQLVRASGLPGAATMNVTPVTAPWVASGDLRLTPVVDPFADTGTRLRVEPRFGTDSAPGLDLSAAAFADQRGIVVDLPLTGVVTGTVVVVARYTDWLRASELCGDPLWQGITPCVPGNAPAGADGYLPRVAGRDVIRERYEWQLLSTESADFATDGLTGARFLVESDRIRLLTDRLGVFQAFETP